MSKEHERRESRDEGAGGPPGSDDPYPRTPRRRPDRRRFPAWLAIPVATLGGFMAADWPGALFGAVAGWFLWRSRR